MLRKRGIRPFCLQNLRKSGCSPGKPLVAVVRRWMEKGCEGLQLLGYPERLCYQRSYTELGKQLL